VSLFYTDYVIAKLKKILRYSDIFFLVISCSLFIFGSTTSFKDYTLPISIAGVIALFGIFLIQKKKILLPKSFLLYFLFLIVLIFHTLKFKSSSNFALLFLSGGAFWVAIYNLKDYVSKLFFPFLIALGFSMAGVYLISNALGMSYLHANNLFLPLGAYILHNHLGDLWAIILVGLLYKMSVKVKGWHIPILILGIIFIALSLSRSAVVSLIVGVVYVYYKSDKLKLSKGWIISIIAGAVLIFLYSSSFKSILFSRPYLVESIKIFVRRPLGLGMGNFYKISPESSVAHNIILEFVVGMGIFSFPFIVWIIGVLRNFWENKSGVLYQAIFLAIFTNFLFDTTYTIPTMLWLWFVSLALAI